MADLDPPFELLGPGSPLANNLIQYCQHRIRLRCFKVKNNKQTVQLNVFTPKLPVTVSSDPHPCTRAADFISFNGLSIHT